MDDGQSVHPVSALEGYCLLSGPRRFSIVVILISRFASNVHLGSDAVRLAIHLFNHDGPPEAEDESRVEHLHEHMCWEPGLATQVVKRAEHAGIISRRDGHLGLTEVGRRVARQAIVKRACGLAAGGYRSTTGKRDVRLAK